ncbi:alpha/beta hydrolase-fold protein [Mycolicibacterium litorale]|uniref:alpha/beta hydrolase-fold protein n=1 Tax=Mycolicibacterium litorale TaxID=758802 RepID=UPI0010657166|nr:alpha/beta hydrolase-fold protein [Mycolicibacterium litorale]TDY09811.1 putative esterase [Mycolicibacterium litorale]
MSLISTALLPVRVARRVVGAVANAIAPSPAPAADLVVLDGMPEGVPPAALQREPALPAPASWPFGEHFPRTCGTGRFAEGALFWTDFLYDDHGASGVPVRVPTGGAPARGTYVYPEGPAADNGADIFRVAIGLDTTHTWWRIDWNTLLDSAIPIGLFTFDTDRSAGGTNEWPANAGVRSAGIDLALLMSGQGAWLIDLTTGTRTAVEHRADMESRTFLAKVPRPLVAPSGTWTVRLGAGLADEDGDGFAEVPFVRGAGPGQPNVYNLAFRTREQEKVHLNFWSDQAQADALDDGDVSQFSLAVPWDQLAARRTDDEPVVTGTSTRWYVSSIELGQGVGDGNILDTKPQFLGRVQPYSVCLPATYAPGRKLPLTLMLHSLALGQNQYAAFDPKLLHEVCDGRNSIVVTPLARGPACWYFDEGELDVWEVFARVVEQLGADPNRTVIAGYSMGGYGTYKLGLSYPEVFAQAVVLAGPPTCGVRLVRGVEAPADFDPTSHCAREGDTWPLLANARWLPFVIAHGGLDQFVPFPGIVQQVFELDRLGYRYRFAAYPVEDHIAFLLKDDFDDPVAHMGTGLRQADPGHITFAWYPQLVREDLGIGPHRVWWVSELRAADDVTAQRGRRAKVDARSYARPDRTRTIKRRRGVIPDFDPTPGLFTEMTWQLGGEVDPMPWLTLDLSGVAGVAVDVVRAGLATLPRSTIAVSTDHPVRVRLASLPPGTAVELDGAPAGAVVDVPEGRSRLTLTAAGSP